MTRLLGVPLLEHLIRLLRENGFRELCLTLGHKSNQITEYFGDGSHFGVKICYMLEDTPLGTAGGVRACEDFIDGEDFLVISGDAACDFPLRELYERHISTRSDLTMALYSHPTPLPYGTVVTDGNGFILSFIEKPSWNRVVTDFVNTGIYLISPHVMDLVPKNTQYDFARDLFPILQHRGYRMTGHEMAGYWCDVGDPESFRKCTMDALGGKLHALPASGDYFFPGHGVFRMENDVIVIAPCLISRKAQIGSGSVIEQSSIHAGSTIGTNCHIRDCVVDGAAIGGECVLEGGIFCREASLPSGSVTRTGAVFSKDGEFISEPCSIDAEQSEKKRERGLCRELSCEGRAELMRQLSAALWEAGADFSDGISLRDGKCRVRIYPLDFESAISIEATGGRESDRLAACKRYSTLAESFGGKTKT